MASMRASAHRVKIVLATVLAAASAVARQPASPTPAARPVGRRPLAAVRQWQAAWSRGAVFYEIFVRSYQDSDGDGIGDLRGLTARLDYLNDGDPATTRDLGIGALWLMPIFASPSYHGYDVADYEAVNPQYGTLADFTTLCAEAHKRGIRVILDLIVNHSSSEHPWFVDSASSPAAAHRDWYVWSPTDPGWRQPWGGNTPSWHAGPHGGYYYGIFWSGMPDLNFRSAAVRSEVKRLAALWLARGADGFRLDAARYLVEDGAGGYQQDTPETHAYWKELSAYLRTIRPDATLVGESWADTGIISGYYGSSAVISGGDELPMCFDFPLSDEIVRGVNSGSGSGIAAKLAEVARRYPAGANDAPFLTNHDQVRVATQLARTPGRLRSAAAVLLTGPGTPFMYYGEEVGIENGSTSGDESKRSPMPWDASAGGGFTTGSPWFPFSAGRAAANVATQVDDPSSLLARYRSLIGVRNASPALAGGSLEVLASNQGGAAILAFVRASGNERVLVVHNLGDGSTGAGPFKITATGFDRLFGDPGVTNPSGNSNGWTVQMWPRSTGIWRIR
jgi:alpha-amylase